MEPNVLMTIPPSVFLLAAAVICIVLPKQVRAAFAVFASLATMYFIMQLPAGNHLQVPFLAYTLEPLRVDALSRIFGIIFTLISALAALYGLAISSRGEIIAALVYASGSLSVTFAGDYGTLYVGWELMMLSSVYLILANPNIASRRAAFRYFFVHLTGGILLLSGILLLLNESGSLAIAALDTTIKSPAAYLILAGFALNAAVVPLHAWLSDAYPRATVFGGVVLSALTTKTALYALARVFPGWGILVILGVIMTVYGVVFAFLADDIRQVLAYHIVSQVGFMVAGVGLGTETAINGAVAHAFCHILYKALLFMGTGAVIYATGKSRLSEMGGLYRGAMGIFILYMVGAVSISGFPLFNGFTSKSMTIYAAGEVGNDWAYTLMYLASVGTFLSVGIKLPYFAWFHKKTRHKITALPITMYLGMAITAALCFILGVYPDLLYRALPFPVTYRPFTTAHILHTCWLLLGTGFGFYLYVPKIKMERMTLIDTDWFYRRPKDVAYTIFVEQPGRCFDAFERISLRCAHYLSDFARNPHAFFAARELADQPFDENRQRAPLSWTVAAVLLTFMLVGIWMLMGN